MFTFIWTNGQVTAVESLKTQNSNVYDELLWTERPSSEVFCYFCDDVMGF